MRTVKLDLAVKDIYRLHQALREAQPPYAVLGVGIDNRFTYINLHDSEQRDPTDLVMSLFPHRGSRRIITCSPERGAFLHILTGVHNALRAAGHSTEMVESKTVPTEFDLYLGCSGSRQDIPPKGIRRGRVGIHVNPYGEAKVGSSEGGPVIDESDEGIKWVLAQEPDFVYCYCTDTFKDRYYGYWRSKHGIPVVGFPAAADIVVYRPRPPQERFKCQVGWVGGRWPYKDVMLNRFLKPLFNKACLIYGLGNVWGNGLTIADIDVPSLFSSAKICPSVSESHAVHHPIDIPERVYKVPAAGGFTIHTPSPAIPDMFGDVIPMATDVQHWLDLVNYYLANEDKRRQLAKRQHEAVLDSHTYFDRCTAIARVLGDDVLRCSLVAAKIEHVKSIKGLASEVNSVY